MLTQRLSSTTQKDGAFIQEFIRIVKENPGSCDEVWLSTIYGFPPMEVHREMAQTLKETAQKLRDAGLRVSLQLSNSIGHGEYMASCDCTGLVYEGSPVRNLVGHDGVPCRYCFCWNDPVMRAYVCEQIQIYVQAVQPHTVWIDDDVCADNHPPLRYGCFCDDCIARFNRENGISFTREELVYAINHGDPKYRRAFVAQMREGLADFTYEVYRAIHEVCPDCYGGYENASYSYTGGDQRHLYEAMRRATGKAPKSRPGGGVYTDNNPNDFLSKAEYLAWQNATLPEVVTDIRPEIENLPDVHYGKSIAGTCFETTLYLAWGASAMSYAMLMNDYESMQWHGEMLAAFATHRPYWERLSRASAGTVAGGFKLCMGQHMWKRPLAEKEADFAWMWEPLHTASVFRPLGVGVTFETPANPVYLLHPGYVAGLTDDEIRKLLHCPVLTCGAALEALAKRGFADCFSADATAVSTLSLYETFTGHPVNRGYTEAEKGVMRKTWKPAYYYECGHILIDKNGKTEPLGHYASDSVAAIPTFPGEEHPYGCADAIVHTNAGARWAVFGNPPWNNDISSYRRNQMMAAADYISGNALTAMLDTPAKALLLPRENREGKLTSVSVVNLTVGQSGTMQLRMRRPALREGQTSALFCAMTIAPYHLPLQRDGEDWIVTLPSIPAWSIGTLFLEA